MGSFLLPTLYKEEQTKAIIIETHIYTKLLTLFSWHSTWCANWFSFYSSVSWQHAQLALRTHAAKTSRLWLRKRKKPSKHFVRQEIRSLLVAVMISRKKWRRLKMHTSHCALISQVRDLWKSWRQIIREVFYKLKSSERIIDKPDFGTQTTPIFS